MNIIDKKDVSIIIPVYYEHSIQKTVAHYSELGFDNIIIIFDNPVATAKRIDSAGGVLRLYNHVTNGFNKSSLRGLYNTNTRYALLLDASKLLSIEQIDEFIEYGIKGNYGLLFSNWTNDSDTPVPNTSKYLKSRFGIFIDDPDYELTFINKAIIDASKTENILTEKFFYLNLITLALNTKQKIGTYNVSDSVHLFNGKAKGFRISNSRYYRKRSNTIRQKRSDVLHNNYFKYTFPDIEGKKLRNQILTIVLSAIVGALTAVGVQYLYKLIGLN